MFGVEGTGDRVVAGVIPDLPDGKAVGPESGDQVRPHDGATEILLLLEAVAMVVVRHEPLRRDSTSEEIGPTETSLRHKRVEEHSTGDIESIKRDSQGVDRETRRMKLGESRLDNKHHGVAEALVFEELSKGREGVRTVRDGLRRRARENVIEVLRVEVGTARAAGVERGFTATFPVCERSPMPELKFHYVRAMGALAAGHGCVEGVPADGVKEGEVPAFLFEDVGLGFK